MARLLVVSRANGGFLTGSEIFEGGTAESIKIVESGGLRVLCVLPAGLDGHAGGRQSGSGEWGKGESSKAALTGKTH